MKNRVIFEQSYLSTIIIGDWVGAVSAYSPGLNSDGGIGCVLGLHTESVVDELIPRTIALDIHKIIFNRKERGVTLNCDV